VTISTVATVIPAPRIPIGPTDYYPSAREQLLVNLPTVDCDSTLDQLLYAINAVKIVKRQAAEYLEKLEPLMIDYINEHGEFSVGDIRYYVGNETKIKCNSPKATLEKLFEVTEGDFDRVAACLASGAFKPAAAREVLGAEFGSQFTTTVETDLKTGKPVKGLKEVNSKFIR